MKRAISIILTLTVLLCCAVTSAHADTAATELDVLGDVDGDRVVTILDATYLQRHLSDIPIPFDFKAGRADADEDGDVTILDATSIQRWLIDAGYRLNIGDEVYEWFDIADAYRVDYFDGGYFTIIRICQTCFYAYNEDYGVFYKLNGRLSDSWSVNDAVFCTFENIYTHDQLAQADMMTILPADEVPDPYICYKPVIYLYPEEETDVSVRLDLDGTLDLSYPAYEDGWQVNAAPDGTLTASDGRVYPYLFWEGKLNTEYDFSTGFCVSGSDTEAFLKEALATLGLNQTETDDFIKFWLPFMKRNPYNVISFQTTAYTDAAKLDISPQPDSTIRVFMAWYGADEAVDIPAQTLTPAQRSGFTAVEWGGAYTGHVCPILTADH